MRGEDFWDTRQAGRFLNYLPDPNAGLESYYSAKLKPIPFISIRRKRFLLPNSRGSRVLLFIL